MRCRHLALAARRRPSCAEDVTDLFYAQLRLTVVLMNNVTVQLPHVRCLGAASLQPAASAKLQPKLQPGLHCKCKDSVKPYRQHAPGCCRAWYMTSLNSRSVLHASSTPAPSVSSTDDEEYHGRNRMSTTCVKNWTIYNRREASADMTLSCLFRVYGQRAHQSCTASGAVSYSGPAPVIRLHHGFV